MIYRMKNRLYNVVNEVIEDVAFRPLTGTNSLNFFPAELVHGGLNLWLANLPHPPSFHLLYKCIKLIGLTRGLPYDTQGKIKNDLTPDLKAALPTIIDSLKHIDNHNQSWVDIYSPRVTLLLESWKHFFAYQEVHSRPEAWVRRPIGNTGEFRQVRISQLINGFISHVRKVLRSKKFRIKEANWLGEYRRRMKSVKAYVDGLFSIYSKLLVIRIDLYQEKFMANELQRRCDEGWQPPDGELQALQINVDRLLHNRRHNAIFKECVGYLIKQEYASIRGWHAHAIFFFNGQAVENDSFYSVVIGDYWRNVITDGKGAYRAANRSENKAEYQYCGIGVIDHRNTAKRDILINKVIDYLAKSDLHVRCQGYAGQKLLRKGVLPATSTRNAGRPRLKSHTSICLPSMGH